MIKWDPETNCLTQWQVPGWPQPLRFTGWGCEVGNWFGFFAQERLGGLACRIQQRHLDPPTSTRLASSWRVELPRATFQIHLADELVSPNCLVRHLTIKNPSREVSWIGDAVIRQVVPWEEGLVAQVGRQGIVHLDSNFYYDTEGPEVTLRWPDGRQLRMQWSKEINAPPPLTPYLYLRDQPAIPRYTHQHSERRAWVAHARLLAEQPAAFTYRWRRFICWDRGRIGRLLISLRRLGPRWRAGEWRLSGRGVLNGLWPMMPDQELDLSVRVEASS